MPEYKIIIESTDQKLEASLNPNDIDEATNKKLKKPNQKKPDKSDTEAIIQTVESAGSALAGLRLVVDPTIQHISETYQLEGETLKSQRLASQYNNITKNIDLGLGIASDIITAIATKNPLIIAQRALNIAQQAMGLSREIRRYTVQKNVDLYRQTYLSQRLVKNISEVR